MSVTKAQLVGGIGISTVSNLTVYGGLTATSGNFSGIVTSSGAVVSDALTATSGNFSGIITSSGAVVSGALTATSFVGNLTGNVTGNISGNVNSTGVSTFSGGANFNNLLRETVRITAGKLSDNTNINLDNGMVHHFTTTETTTSRPNIISSVGINTQMAVGQTSAVTIITTAAAAGYSTAINIDGTYNYVRWSGGSAPTTGGSSGNDVYSFQIIKTASATYTVLGTLNNFA
jgi:hypothetical protein